MLKSLHYFKFEIRKEIITKFQMSYGVYAAQGLILICTFGIYVYVLLFNFSALLFSIGGEIRWFLLRSLFLYSVNLNTLKKSIIARNPVEKEKWLKSLTDGKLVFWNAATFIAKKGEDFVVGIWVRWTRYEFLFIVVRREIRDVLCKHFCCGKRNRTHNELLFLQ